MKQKIWLAVTIFLFMGGLGLAIYPMISEWSNAKIQQQIAEEYQEKIKNTKETDLSEEWQKAFDYNNKLRAGHVVLSEPFDETKFVPSEEDYDSVLNLDGSGIMGYLEIPAIKVKLAIYHSVEDEVLRTATGHLPGTSLPVGGEGTHSVISSHSGVASAKLFTDLEKMVIGDIFYIHVLDETLAYKVDEINVVEPEDVSKLAITDGKDYVTLVTCTPYAVNTHRLLVRGVRTEYVEAEESFDAGERGLPYGWQGWLILIPSVIGIFAVIAARKKKKR